jgi:hypothetical protein
MYTKLLLLVIPQCLNISKHHVVIDKYYLIFSLKSNFFKNNNK